MAEVDAAAARATPYAADASHRRASLDEVLEVGMAVPPNEGNAADARTASLRSAAHARLIAKPFGGRSEEEGLFHCVTGGEGRDHAPRRARRSQGVATLERASIVADLR